MKRYLLLLLALTFISCAPKVKTLDPEEKCHKPLKTTFEQFDRLKGLVGKWKGIHKTAKGKESVQIEYQLTSGGSALVEKLFPGTPHEMVSVYTPTKTATGSTVTMTHYCMLGNQPRMQINTADKKAIFFDFLDAKNMASAKDPHMHSLKIKLIDSYHFTQEWTFYQDGKKTKVETFSYSRK